MNVESVINITDAMMIAMCVPNIIVLYILAPEILKDLTRFPYKYPLYHVQKWSAKGIRQFTFRNDVILYSVNEKEQIVYIWAVCTKGRDLTAHLEEYT